MLTKHTFFSFLTQMMMNLSQSYAVAIKILGLCCVDPKDTILVTPSV